ncbi:uncharacterized protein KZ484_018568 isoform 1-T1 [Pholidichthys leucotaenia]
MAPNKRKQKKSLKLDCEWGSCQDSFDRMETFSKHNENHLVALKAEEEDEAEAPSTAERPEMKYQEASELMAAHGEDGLSPVHNITGVWPRLAENLLLPRNTGLMETEAFRAVLK